MMAGSACYGQVFEERWIPDNAYFCCPECGYPEKECPPKPTDYVERLEVPEKAVNWYYRCPKCNFPDEEVKRNLGNGYLKVGREMPLPERHFQERQAPESQTHEHRIPTNQEQTQQQQLQKNENHFKNVTKVVGPYKIATICPQCGAKFEWEEDNFGSSTSSPMRDQLDEQYQKYDAGAFPRGLKSGTRSQDLSEDSGAYKPSPHWNPEILIPTNVPYKSWNNPMDTEASNPERQFVSTKRYNPQRRYPDPTTHARAQMVRHSPPPPRPEPTSSPNLKPSQRFNNSSKSPLPELDELDNWGLNRLFKDEQEEQESGTDYGQWNEALSNQEWHKPMDTEASNPERQFVSTKRYNPQRRYPDPTTHARAQMVRHNPPPRRPEPTSIPNLEPSQRSGNSQDDLKARQWTKELPYSMSPLPEWDELDNWRLSRLFNDEDPVKADSPSQSDQNEYCKPTRKWSSSNYQFHYCKCGKTLRKLGKPFNPCFHCGK